MEPALTRGVKARGVKRDIFYRGPKETQGEGGGVVGGVGSRSRVVYVVGFSVVFAQKGGTCIRANAES